VVVSAPITQPELAACVPSARSLTALLAFDASLTDERTLLDIGVSYRGDVDEMIKMLVEVGAELRRDPQFAGDILDDLEVVGIDDFAATQMIVKLRIKTQPSKQWRIARDSVGASRKPLMLATLRIRFRL
jgi:hypothetical protein